MPPHVIVRKDGTALEGLKVDYDRMQMPGDYNSLIGTLLRGFMEKAGEL